MRSDRSLFAGRYLFHFHTVCTDGALSVREYFEYAALHGVERLIFLEHIRREPTYDVPAFAAAIEEEARRRQIPAAVGFEARLLPDGCLDIQDQHLRLARVVGIAEHGFVDDRMIFQAAFRRAVDTYSALRPEQAVVWVHPGLWYKKRALLDRYEADYLELLQFALDHGVLIERNLRYDLLPETVRGRLDPTRVVLGADAHRRADLDRWAGEFGEASPHRCPERGQRPVPPVELLR